MTKQEGHCDMCHKPYENGHPSGGISTRNGVVEVCSSECFQEAMNDPEICPLGELMKIEKSRDGSPNN